MKMKNVIALLMVATMVGGMSTTTFAQSYDSDKDAVVGEQKDMTNNPAQDGASGETQFKVVDKSDTVPTYQLRVTVPMTVTFAVAKDGTTSVPTNYALRNYSAFDVEVSNVKATNGEWKLTNNPTNAKEVNMGYTLPSSLPFSLADAVGGAGVTTDWKINCGKITDEEPTGASKYDLKLNAKAAAGKNIGATDAGAVDAYSVAYTVKLLDTREGVK